jgi:3-mercaptopyruvate sulfurtransferase SseA
MYRLRLIAQSFGLILVTSLLVSCGASSVFVAPTTTPEPTPTPEPTATPEPPKSSSEVPRISAEELKERLDNGEEILIVDSRANSVFETRHIAGAISVPHYEVDEHLDEFPRDQEIVFY